MTDVYGQDIKLDEYNQPLVAANGELLMTDGTETGVQDIKLRLFTPLGGLFYDVKWGSLLHEWVHDESTPASRLAFAAELARRVRLDPRAVPTSVVASVRAFDETGITALVVWRFIGEDHERNLVVSVDSEKMEVLIKDVDPAV